MTFYFRPYLKPHVASYGNKQCAFNLVCIHVHIWYYEHFPQHLPSSKLFLMFAIVQGSLSLLEIVFSFSYTLCRRTSLYVHAIQCTRVWLEVKWHLRLWVCMAQGAWENIVAICTPTSNVRLCVSLCPHQIGRIFLFLIFTIRWVKWLSVLICIFGLLMMLNMFILCLLLPFGGISYSCYLHTSLQILFICKSVILRWNNALSVMNLVDILFLPITDVWMKL